MAPLGLGLATLLDRVRKELDFRVEILHPLTRRLGLTNRGAGGGTEDATVRPCRVASVEFGRASRHGGGRTGADHVLVGIRPALLLGRLRCQPLLSLGAGCPVIVRLTALGLPTHVLSVANRRCTVVRDRAL